MKWWLIFQCCVLKIMGLTVLAGTDYTLLGWLLFFCGGGVVLYHIFAPRGQGLCDVVTSFHSNGKEVWLTIDDGPDADDTPAILDMLAEHNAKATFFMIGERAAKHPELVETVLTRGHTVGSHTHTHPLSGFWIASRQRVKRELDDSCAVLNAQGAAVQLYRSPVGFKNFFLRHALRERQLSCVAWTIRSGDGLGKDPAAIVARVGRELRPGAIVLMHEGVSLAPEVRVEAIRGVLALLQREGYRCVLPNESTYIT
ncbi:MAG: polysaccharide deacetylase family protein [Opitutaceae bacterium]